MYSNFTKVFLFWRLEVTRNQFGHYPSIYEHLLCSLWPKGLEIQIGLIIKFGIKNRTATVSTLSTKRYSVPAIVITCARKRHSKKDKHNPGPLDRSGRKMELETDFRGWVRLPCLLRLQPRLPCASVSPFALGSQPTQEECADKRRQACGPGGTLGQGSDRAIRGLHGAPWGRLFSLGNFHEALKRRQGKGGGPILEVRSLVIYSSTWALERQPHKHVPHSAPPCVRED